jgi:hypothetical protein
MGVRHPEDSGREQTVDILFMRKDQRIVAVVHYDRDSACFLIEVLLYYLLYFPLNNIYTKSGRSIYSKHAAQLASHLTQCFEQLPAAVACLLATFNCTVDINNQKDQLWSAKSLSYSILAKRSFLSSKDLGTSKLHDIGSPRCYVPANGNFASNMQ